MNIENPNQECTLCRRYGLEKGDTLYQVGYPDTGDVSYIALLEGRIEPVTLSLCGCCGARMDGDAE